MILNLMKIRTPQIREIIREELEEQGWVPGRWYPSKGEPIDPDEVDLMGTDGLGATDEDEEEHVHLKGEVRELVKMMLQIEAKKRPGLWANIRSRRKAGKKPRRPGEKGYPKTLDIGEGDNEDNNR